MLRKQTNKIRKDISRIEESGDLTQEEGERLNKCKNDVDVLEVVDTQITSALFKADDNIDDMVEKTEKLTGMPHQFHQRNTKNYAPSVSGLLLTALVLASVLAVDHYRDSNSAKNTLLFLLFAGLLKQIADKCSLTSLFTQTTQHQHTVFFPSHQPSSRHHPHQSIVPSDNGRSASDILREKYGLPARAPSTSNGRPKIEELVSASDDFASAASRLTQRLKN